MNLIHQYPQVAEIIARTIEERKINEAKVKAAAALKAKEEADAKERERIEQERLARQEEEEEEAQTDEHSRNVLAERFKKSMGSVGSLLSNGFKKSFTNLAAGASRNASQNQLNAAEGGVVGGSTNQLNQTSNGILHGSGAKLDIVNREGLGPRSLSDRPGSRNAGGEGLSSGPSLVVRRMSERELILSSRTPPRIESRTDVIGRESLGFRRASVASESNQVAAAPRVSISNVKSSNTTTNS